MTKKKITNTKSPLDNKYLRRPGQSLDEQIGMLEGKQLIWIILLGITPGFILIEWMYYFINTPMQPMIATILAAIFMSVCLWKANQIKKEIQNYQLGRDGERAVAEDLENLIRLTGCYVYHDVVCENSEGQKFNIDHVIVSSYGIFVIETKARSKPAKGEAKVDFDGNSVKLTGHPPDSKPIQQARGNIRWLRDKIRDKTGGRLFAVTAIVVYPGWWVGKEQMRNGKDTWVMNPKLLEFEVMQQKPTLTPDDIKIVTSVVHPLTQAQRNPD